MHTGRCSKTNGSLHEAVQRAPAGGCPSACHWQQPAGVSLLQEPPNSFQPLRRKTRLLPTTESEPCFYSRRGDTMTQTRLKQHVSPILHKHACTEEDWRCKCNLSSCFASLWSLFRVQVSFFFIAVSTCLADTGFFWFVSFFPWGSNNMNSAFQGTKPRKKTTLCKQQTLDQTIMRIIIFFMEQCQLSLTRK